MNAALRLSWYKFKHHYMDFVKVLLGIVAFEGLILYIQDKGFLKDFETTRMTLFLLLFSTSLLIVVQNSKEGVNPHTSQGKGRTTQT